MMSKIIHSRPREDDQKRDAHLSHYNLCRLLKFIFSSEHTVALPLTNYSTTLLYFNFPLQHCSKGKTVYAPQIVFLHCGGSSALPRGVWYHYSYGTIAMYKADWDRFGGFSNRFVNKVTWGGEDWDIIDGVVKSGLEIERKRCPWVYHYYHTKAGMWSKRQR